MSRIDDLVDGIESEYSRTLEGQRCRWLPNSGNWWVVEPNRADPGTKRFTDPTSSDREPSLCIDRSS